jgi:hypothetical protein
MPRPAIDIRRGVELHETSPASAVKAATTAAWSCSPIGPSTLVHVPSGAARSRSTIRPRSQRDVDGNGATAPRAPGRVRVGTIASAPLGSCATSRHQLLAGQATQSGRRGRQTVAPTSIRACVQSAGRSGGTVASASCWSSGPVRPLAAPTAIRPSTRRTLVSTAPTGWPNAMAAIALAVYGPIPGSASSERRPVGTRPSWMSTIRHAARQRLSARRL